MRIASGVEQEPGFQGKPKEPLRDMLRWLTGKAPPKFVTGYTYKNLTDEQSSELQDWAVNTLDRTPVYWGTGIGVIEAAEKLVEEAVSNGNIPAEDSKWRTEGHAPSWFTPRALDQLKKKKKSVR